MKIDLQQFFVAEKSWGNIKEVEPDDIDFQMLKEVEENSDCHKFVSATEAYKELGL